MAFNTQFSTFRTNGLQIATNNFQWLWSNTANPTTRPDGSALVAGDRILVNPTAENSGDWVWDGLYWRSAQRYHVFDTNTWTVANASISTNGAPTGKIIRPDLAIYAIRISTVYQCSPTLNANNRWDIVAFRSTTGTAPVSLLTPGTNLQATGLVPANNFQAADVAERRDNIVFQYQRVGNPSSLVARSILEYQLIRP